jgi:hypothetical protein
MVQIIPANQKHSFLESLGIGVGKGLEKGADLYLQKLKDKEFTKALKGVEDLYNDPNLSEQQKLINAYKLMGQFPEAAHQLGTPLSRLGLQQQKSFADRLKAEQDQQQTAKAFQNIQNIYSNPDLSDEQKVFGVYQELNKNPTLANNLITSLQKPKKTREEEMGSQLFTKGYNAIYENDTDILKDVLKNPKTPLNVKKQLTDLKNKFDTRKSVEARELRNRQSLVQRSYKQAIEAEQKKLEKVMYPNSKGKPEVEKINNRIKKLEVLQKHDLKRLSQNPDSYATLSKE